MFEGVIASKHLSGFVDMGMTNESCILYRQLLVLCFTAVKRTAINAVELIRPTLR
jgi:hypothetical protein